MYDVAIEARTRINAKEVLKKYNLSPKNFILVTIHRAENTDDEKNLKNIFFALKDIAEKGIVIFFPIHPRTKKALNERGLSSIKRPDTFIISSPVSYLEMIALESNARVIITDSGGVQKEGYFFKTPCVIPRKETEWMELVEAGWNKLTGTDRAGIVDTVLSLWTEGVKRKKWIPFYGDGDAALRTVKIIIQFLSGNL